MEFEVDEEKKKMVFYTKLKVCLAHMTSYYGKNVETFQTSP